MNERGDRGQRVLDQIEAKKREHAQRQREALEAELEARENEEREQAAARLRSQLVVLEAIESQGVYWPGD